MVFDYCTSNQAMYTQCSRIAQSHGFESVRGCGLDWGKVVGHVSRAHVILMLMYMESLHTL